MAEIRTITNEIILADEEDVDYLRTFRWYLAKGKWTNYARTKIFREDGKQTTAFIHRLLLKPSESLLVDHINGNGMDNRRGNLRLCTPSENRRNSRCNRVVTDGIKGVYRGKNEKTWMAMVRVQGEAIYLGRFPTIEKAGRAYDSAAIELFGEFANLNFPDFGKSTEGG